MSLLEVEAEFADDLGRAIQRDRAAAGIDVEAAANSLPAATAAMSRIPCDQRVGDGRGGTVRVVDSPAVAVAAAAAPLSNIGGQSMLETLSV